MEIETIKYSDGIYKGEVQNEQPHGKGKLTIYEGKIPISKYIGEFKNDNFHGQGSKKWSNGDVYRGQWKDGKRNGEGIQIWANGDECDCW